jgi:hypothetical protein
LLAPAAVQVISTSGKREIDKARTSDRAGRTMATALVLALVIAITRKSWGCGQREDKSSREKYLGFHKHDCSPLIKEPAEAIWSRQGLYTLDSNRALNANGLGAILMFGEN